MNFLQLPSHLRTAVFAICIMVIWMTFAGCSTRESAKAAKQADQSMQASAQLLASPELVTALSSLPEENSPIVQETFRQIQDLLAQGRRSQAPVIARLEGDEPVTVATTVEMAKHEPKLFIDLSTTQAAAAAAEADDAKAGSGILSLAVKIAASVGISLGSLGTGGVIGAILAGAPLARSLWRNRKALIDAVKTGEVLAEIDPDDATALSQAKKTQADAQDANGTRALIKDALATIKKAQT